MEGSSSSTVPLWDEAQQNASSLEDCCVIDSEKQSLYVKVFQNIQDVVMEHERFLFSVEEQALFAQFNSLTYNARYLFIRLCLCKRGKWHTLPSLERRYISELGDKQSILQAIDELCGKGNNMKQENNGAVVIDLTLSGDEQDIPASIMEAPFSENSLVFAEDEAMASLEELLQSLTAGTLSELAKRLNIPKLRKTRVELIQAILTQSTNQLTLAFPVLSERERCKMAIGRKVTRSRITQSKVVRLQVLKLLGRCIRIPISIFSVIDRLNILFFRSTEYNSSPFLPALLSSFKKRYHAPVEYSRTPNIFLDRQTLLTYQGALVLESKLDEAFSLFSEGSSLCNCSERAERAKVVRGIWEDAYSRWKDVVYLNHDDKMLNPLFSRYHPGHILTRIVHRGLDIISTLKDYTTEIEVLKALLGQTIWGIGRRGAWYDRLALILMKYSGDSVQSLEASIDVVISALEDENTHLIYRPRLQRRLTRLESKLKIPLENRHQCMRKLRDAEHVYIKGVRVRNPEQSNVPSSGTWFPNPDSQTTPPSMKGKTVWVGNNGSQISVEEFALQYYSTLGYQGLHSEGRIIATLFGLLFWDIIFSRIPGAFETPFQSAPLDMFDGTFYIARKEAIEERLQTLRNEGGKEILESVVAREGAQRTMCIGVDWEFNAKDLLDIMKCMRGDVLATICRMISEDYGRWRAGVPDLLIWNSDLQECKFVEVKSANDTLQENQKIWIDILLGAGAAVELCHVLESGPKLSARAKSRKRPKNHDIESADDGDPTMPKKEKKREE